MSDQATENAAKLDAQRQEFNSVARLAARLHQLPPIVDDDYPEARHYYESELRTLVRALRDNGRLIWTEGYDLVAHLKRQREFSERTFGPGNRTQGVIDHIRKELKEVEAAPFDLEEWVDIILLALDGAWRAGHSPQHIAAGILAKQEKNESRDWPDWRKQPADKAIEHHR